MKVMISQPMKNLSEDIISRDRKQAEEVLKKKGYTIVNNYFKKEWKESDKTNKDLWYLGKSLQKMAECDAVYFCDGWFYSSGCQLEYQAACKYGLKILFKSSLEMEDKIIISTKGTSDE